MLLLILSLRKENYMYQEIVRRKLSHSKSTSLINVISL